MIAASVNELKMMANESDGDSFTLDIPLQALLEPNDVEPLDRHHFLTPLIGAQGFTTRKVVAIRNHFGFLLSSLRSNQDGPRTG